MPTPNWKRLGELLVRRRIELDPRYSNRQLFAAERGLNYRTVSDAERGRRDNYEDGTIASLEVAYALAPGSVARALTGGDLEPLPAPQPAAAALSGSGALTASGGDEALAREAAILFPGDPAKQAIWRTDEPREAKVARIDALDRFPGDPTKQAIWRTGEPEDVKLALIDVLDRKRETAALAREAPAAG